MDTVQQQPKVKQFKEDLNEKQLKAFNDLKAKIEQEIVKLIDRNDKDKYDRYTEDNQVVRLLWAREFKVDKSFEMWKKWVNWRLEFKADEIKEADIESELKSGKAFWHGKDKLNNPCLVVKVKHHRPGVSSQDVVLKYFLYQLEEGIKKCEAAGTGKLSVIWDREGFDKKNFDSALFNTFKKLNQIMQDNYAERLSTVYILHPNWFFKTIYAIVKPFLTSRTKSKITIVDKIDDLKKYFDPNELLIEHGGTSNYQFVYPPPPPPQLEVEQKEQVKPEINVTQEQQKPLVKQQIQKNQTIDENDSDEGFTEEDFHQIEESMIEQTQESKEYDINSLSESMFNKVITMNSIPKKH